MRDWLALARPRQWVKNLLLYAAFLFTAGEAWQPGDPDSWLPLLARATVAFALFCLLASGGYFLNDAADAEADRVHPRKLARPIAAGRVAPEAARRTGATLLLAGVAASLVLGPWFALLAAAYATGAVAYTYGLKRFAILDAAVVAALFAARAVAGALAIEVEASRWLVVCTFAGALFVAAVKRHQEARLLGDRAASHRASLHASPKVLAALVPGAGATTVALYAAYAGTASNLPDDRSMLLTVPLVALGVARYWWVARAKPDRDADEVVLRDPLLVVTVGAFVLLAVALLAR